MRKREKIKNEKERELLIKYITILTPQCVAVDKSKLCRSER